VLDDEGKPVQTLWNAAAGPLVTWFIVCLSILALGLWMRGSFHEVWAVGALILLYLVFYALAAHTKKFETDERMV